MPKVKTPPEIEGEYVDQRKQAQTESLAIRSAPINVALLSPVVDLATAQRQLAEFQKFVSEYLIEGTEGEGDYGSLPGSKKKCLHQSGAHKLCELYGYAPTFPDNRIRRTERWELTPPLFDYEVTCVLIRKGTDCVIAEGLGSCNSYESKYRYRKEERKCPECGAPAIIKGKAQYGGGWVCWKKKDGCGENFPEDDERIVSQHVGRVPNEDIADQKNTILKISAKRSLVSATIAATRSSGLFTVDMEHAEVRRQVDAEEDPFAAEEHGESQQQTQAKPVLLKFAGTVGAVAFPVEGDANILVMKVERPKSKKKERNWTVKGKIEFVTLVSEAPTVTDSLRESSGKKVEVECSEQPGKAGHIYFRIERVISIGGKPPAVKKPTPQAVADQMGDGVPSASAKAEAERQTKVEADPTIQPCTCKHPNAIHVDGGKGKCTEPKCFCKKFTPRPAATGSTAPAAAEPAKVKPKIDIIPPMIEVVNREITVGGKAKTVTWNQITGTVTGGGRDQTAKKVPYIRLYIGGLPEWHVADNRKRPHDTFILYHQHLFDAMATAKPGDKVIVEYESKRVNGERDPKRDGDVHQVIEDIVAIAGRIYENGKEVFPDQAVAGVSEAVTYQAEK